MLDWQHPKYLNNVKDGEVILISHNRGTWHHPADQSRIECVVVFRSGNSFREFGPDSFRINEIASWARFNPPNA